VQEIFCKNYCGGVSRTTDWWNLFRRMGIAFDHARSADCYIYFGAHINKLIS
jgi:hypothetical protein